MSLEDNKTIATSFLTMVVKGQIDEAYAKYVSSSGKHHNVFTPSGFEALKEGMIDNEQQFPGRKFIVQRVIAEDDLVVVHACLTADNGAIVMSVVHIMRIAEGKIVELWDVAQPLPKATVNSDGGF